MSNTADCVKSLPIEALTEGTLNGTGVFDVLMKATKAHLKVEFDENRIRGTEYAEAYTQSIQMVLQQAIAFLGLQKQAELTDAQICKLKAEYDLIEAQIAKTGAEINLLTQKRVTEQAQVEEGIIQPESYLGRQIALYIAQKEGFERDAEQKATRIFADAMAVSEGIDQTGLWNDAPNGMTNANMALAVNKLLDGIKANI